MTLAVGLGLGFWLGPDREFFLMGEVLTFALVPIYSAGNYGVSRYSRTERRAEFRPFRYAVLPTASSLAVLTVAYLSIAGWPPPMRYAPLVVAGWLAAGVGVVLLLKAAGREGWPAHARAAGPEAVVPPG